MTKYQYLPAEEQKIQIKFGDWGMLIPESHRDEIKRVVDKLTEDERVQLSGYPTSESDWFKPKGVTGKEVKSFSLKKWETLTFDEKSFYQAACVLREQVLGGSVNPQSIDFYTTVTELNALNWYNSCPEHLRKRIDDAKKTLPSPREVSRKDDEEIWDAISYALGDRPRVQYVVDGSDIQLRSYFQQAVYQRWCAKYQEEQFKKLIVELAPAIQKERRMLNEAMGINVDASGLPSQADGLDPTTSATVRWLQESGEMPLEFLARTYRSEDAKMTDRLTAARTLMDYVHRKIPQKQEVETKSLVPKLDPTTLKGLTEKELDVLEKLLAKIVGDSA